jgi:uncharacterized protein
MGKFLLLLLVLVVAIGWWMVGRRGGLGGRRGSDGGGVPDAGGGRRAGAQPATMLECAHCGVHLPQTEALFDVGGRPYCSEAHRLAGPR